MRIEIQRGFYWDLQLLKISSQPFSLIFTMNIKQSNILEAMKIIPTFALAAILVRLREMPWSLFLYQTGQCSYFI